MDRRQIGGWQQENLLVCLAWRPAPLRRIRLARVHRELQCRGRHQGCRCRRGGCSGADTSLPDQPRFPWPARAHARRLHHSRSRRSSRNLPTLRSRHSPIRAHAASSWTGATSLRCARSGRPTMRGPCSPACCHGRRIAARSPSIRASAVAASITARALTSCGASRTRRPFSNTLRRSYTCRSCSRYGPGSGKAICCGCRGRPMMGIEHPVAAIEDRRARGHSGRCAAQGRARCRTEARADHPHLDDRAAVDAGRNSAPVWRQGVQEGGHCRPYLQRSARHCGHPACACRLHRGARSPPSPGTACATCARSSMRTICTAMSSWRAPPSPSSKWVTRSGPEAKEKKQTAFLKMGLKMVNRV